MTAVRAAESICYAGGVYREIAPPAVLADRVVCVWTLEVGAETHRQRVLPDSCMDVIYTSNAGTRLIGSATAAETVTLAASTRLLGVRFQPGALARRLEDTSVYLDRSVALPAALARSVPPTLDLRANLGELTATLMDQLVERATPPPHADVTECARALASDPWVRIEDVARSLSISPRQLHRLCVKHVGHGAKIWQRVLRLQRALELAPQLRPAELAVIVGYADQPHMLRELRKLGGARARDVLAGGGSALALTAWFAAQTSVHTASS